MTNKQIASENEDVEFIKKIPGLFILREKSRENTILCKDKLTQAPSEPSTNITVCEDNVVNVCYKLRNEKAVVLNFASAYSPGGGYLNGSIAQEEVLCRASTLYNCLVGNISYSQTKNTNGLYESNAIYSPNVPFFRDEHGNILKTPYTMSVISMAAPNAKQAKFKGVSDNIINSIMNARIHRVLEIAKHYNYDTIILGAWGCGVFGNDPNVVAKLFQTALKHYSFKKVYFAIYDKKTCDVFRWFFEL